MCLWGCRFRLFRSVNWIDFVYEVLGICFQNEKSFEYVIEVLVYTWLDSRALSEDYIRDYTVIQICPTCQQVIVLPPKLHCTEDDAFSKQIL